MANPPITQEVVLRLRSDTSGLNRGAKQAQATLKQTASSFKQVQQEGRGAVQQFEVFGQVGSALPGQLGPAAGAVGALTGAFKNARGSLLAFGIVATGVIGGIIKFSDEIGTLIGKIFDADRAFGVFREELKEVRKEAAGTVDDFNKLYDSLFPDEARQRLLQSRIALTEKFRQDATRLLEAQKFVMIAALNPALEGFEAERDRIEKRFNQLRSEIDRRAERAGLRAGVAFDIARANANAGGGGATEDTGGGGGGRARSGGGGGSSSTSPQRTSPARVIGSTTSLGGTQTGSGLGGIGGLGGQFQNFVGIPKPPDEIVSDAEKIAQALRTTDSAAQQFANSMQTIGGAITNAFEEWASGAKSLGDALKEALGSAIGDILIGEAKKHVALATADFLTGNPLGGGGHLAAAAALAAASGGIRQLLGAGSGPGASASGSRLPGAAAGAFGGGRGTSSETIILTGDPDDDDPRGSRRRLRHRVQRAGVQAPSPIVRS